MSKASQFQGKVLEVLSNSFMVRPWKNMMSALLEMAYGKNPINNLGGPSTLDQASEVSQGNLDIIWAMYKNPEDSSFFMAIRE